MERVGSIEAVNAVGPDHSVLKLNELLVGGGGRIGADEESGFLHGEVSKSFDLLDKCFLISLQLEFHVDFAIMNLVLFSEIVLVYHSDGVTVLTGKLALAWSFLFLFHEVYAKNYAAVSGNAVVEVLASAHAHVVHVCTHYVSI